MLESLREASDIEIGPNLFLLLDIAPLKMNTLAMSDGSFA